MREGKVIATAHHVAPLVQSLQIACAAASTDQTRPTLCAVRIYRDADELVIVATDSYVLWEERFGGIEALPEPGFDVLVPAKDLRKSLPAKAVKANVLSLAFEDGRVVVNDETIVSLLSDAWGYPPYIPLFDEAGGPDTADPYLPILLGHTLDFVAKIARIADVGAVALHPGETNRSPIGITIGSRPGARCIVMPVSVD